MSSPIPRAVVRGALLGLDPGERRIGVALAPAGASLALPLTVLERSGPWQDMLAALAGEHGVAEVVVGLPLSLDGMERTAAAGAREFAREVQERLGLPVHLVDERLSTAAAGRALTATGARSRKQRTMVDRSAAAVILQGHLDAQGRA